MPSRPRRPRDRPVTSKDFFELTKKLLDRALLDTSPNPLVRELMNYDEESEADYFNRLKRYNKHVELAGLYEAKKYVRENSHRCMFPMKRGGECALNLGHGGPHTQSAFQCDSCGGYRRGTPHVTNESGAFCYYCVEIWIGKEGF